MSETKYTPGPWTPLRQADNSYNIRALGSLVAEVIPQPSARPNAALIASAPDLYEALAALLTAVDDDSFPGEGGLRHGAFWTAVRSARAALAKAEGRGG